MKLYGELAPWYPLLTHPSDYAEEADHIARLVDAAIEGPAQTLLELGTGGGANASYLKSRFECTLTDLSDDMLDVSRALNPECEHVLGDMRTLRLGRTFDVVLLHDAVMYMVTKDDLSAALVTAAEHLRPGGVLVITPDFTAESFEPVARHGGHDGAGRAGSPLSRVGRRSRPGRLDLRHRLRDAAPRAGKAAPRRVRPARRGSVRRGDLAAPARGGRPGGPRRRRARRGGPVRRRARGLRRAPPPA